MKGLKSVIISSAAAAAVGMASLSAFANGGVYTPPPPPPQPEAGGWFITGGGLWMKPTDSDLSNVVFGDEINKTTSLALLGQSKTNTMQTIKNRPDYQWGGYGELGYHFANSPFDMVLAFHGIFGTDKNSASSDKTIYIVPYNGGTFSKFTGIVANKVDAKLKTDYFTVDAVGRRHWSLGHGVELVPYAGIRFMYLHEELDATAWNTIDPVPIIDSDDTKFNDASLHYKTHFYGLGPILGTNFNAKIVGGLGIFGDLHSALLFGTTDNESMAITKETENEGPINVINTFNVNDSGDRSTRAVPNAGGKIGLDFTFPMNGMFVKLQGGYMGDFYYHAIDNRQIKKSFGAIFSHVSGGFNRGRFSNFTVAGPFAGITIGMDGNDNNGY